LPVWTQGTSKSRKWSSSSPKKNGTQWKTYGYGSIPINTILSGMNIHKSQLFWCELQGYKVLTHPHITWGYLGGYTSGYTNFQTQPHVLWSKHMHLWSSIPNGNPFNWYMCMS
jgi:hypothetical protein